MNRRRAIDGLAAVALTVWLQLQIWGPEPADPLDAFEDPALTSPLLLPATLGVAWRRERPLAVALTYAACVAAQGLVTWDFAASPALFVSALLIVYAAGAGLDRRRAALALGAVVAGLLARDVPELGNYSELDTWNATFFYLSLVVMCAAGVVVRGRREAAALERRAARLEAERRDREAAIAEERAQIARELHDIVAHSVSAAVVQAEAAEEVLTREPERARASLQRIQGASREALGEMRRLLGVMRGAGGADALAPPRGLADLEQLVADASDEDLQVTLEVEGIRGEVPPGIDLSVFRIVQEALTNARRHAGRPARVHVRVRCADDALEVEVTDDGRGPVAAAASPGAGLGLVGMRERAAFFGGSFEAGAGDAGGFRVRVRFPLFAQATSR
jgi:signal transduction histidine kinase